MLLKVTNQCQMACVHCLEDSRPGTGQHMEWSTFLKALDCTNRVEGLARTLTGYNLLLFSGGECTENPRILDMIDEAGKRGFQVTLITNGMWLNDPALAAPILSRPVFVQVTNDPRFYPKAPPRVNRPNVVYVDALTVFHRLGRGVKVTTDVPERKAPSSFNLRSLVRAFGDIRRALVTHRARALTSTSGGHCTPTISWNGDFVVGESRFCAKVGTVDSTPEELTEGVLKMGACDRCGLESKLSAEHKAAIGVPL